VPGTVTLEKGWRQYAETVYYGCPEDFATDADVLDKITPKVFDVKTGKFISPAIPTAAPGENITGGVCALSGTADAIKVIYLMTTTKPANGLNPEVNKVTSYVFDMTSQQPLATRSSNHRHPI
jgi:hypothetical protein